MPSQLEILRESLATLEAKGYGDGIVARSAQWQIWAIERTDARSRGEWPYGENPMLNRGNPPTGVRLAPKG